jgi:glucosyl-3-phosphoglycerate synthase
MQAGIERAQEWAARRSYAHADFSAERLAQLKGSQTVSVVIPARDVAATVGEVAAVCAQSTIVDQVIVIDASSTDGTAEIAAQADATVHDESSLLPQFGEVLGKGDALWRSLSVTTGDIVVFVDGDTSGFDDRFIRGLVGPLLAEEEIKFVKGAFSRPFVDGELRVENGGGRVNELAARPLLSIFFPELAAVRQPLSGEVAFRREAVAELPFCTGYGTEIQMLIDAHRRFGLDAIAQCDLGERINDHQPLQALGAMSFAVIRALLARVDGLEIDYDDHLTFLSADGPRDVPLVDRPPINTVVGAAR